MVSGRVIEWYVEAGQTLKRGEVIGLVDTEKGAIEIEVWEDAVVKEIVAPPGSTVPVGEPLLILDAPGRWDPDAVPDEPSPTHDDDGAGVIRKIPFHGGEAGEEEPASPAPPDLPPPQKQPPPPSPSQGRTRVTPVARRRAAELGLDLASIVGTGPEGAVSLGDVEARAAHPGAEHPAPPPEEATEAPAPLAPRATPVAREVALDLGVDLETLHGTGPGGAISRKDVEAAAARRPMGEAQPEPSESGGDRHQRMRQAIAAAMTRSKREIPHYYLATTVVMEKALLWVEESNRQRPPSSRILPVALHLKALALALGEFPEFNGFWLEEGFRASKAIHPGLAISLRGGGLVAPAIHDAPGMSLEELTVAVREVVQRARSGHLRGSEVMDATITLTSLGDRGVETVFGVIYPPQVAILGVGSVVERPWAENGMVGVRRTQHLTLAADHRASDGHRGGLFLERLAQHLQSPEEL